jgi:phage terminase small subunit
MEQLDLVVTENQREFAKKYVELGSPTEAYRQAYPNFQGKYISQEAWRLLKNPKIRDLIDQIQQDVRARFVLMAPEALERLENLAKDADSEKVRLEANKEILDRAGLKPPEKVELSHLGIFGGTSLEEVKDIIRSNIEGESTSEKVN